MALAANLRLILSFKISNALKIVLRQRGNRSRAKRWSTWSGQIAIQRFSVFPISCGRPTWTRASTKERYQATRSGAFGGKTSFVLL